MPQNTETQTLEYLTISQATLRVQNSTVTCLDITDLSVYASDAWFWKDEATPFANALKINTSLKKLSISDKQGGWTSNDFKIVLEGLRENKHLQTLSLYKNRLNDEDIRNLAGVIATTQLKVLILCDNCISDAGVNALAEILKTNKSLIKLDLSNNEIKKDGAKYLATALKLNSTLGELNLNHNFINFNGFAAIADSLKSNKHLKRLHLKDNNCDTIQILKTILPTLKEQYSLIELQITDTSSTPNGTDKHLLEQTGTIINRNKKIMLCYNNAEELVKELEEGKHRYRYESKYKEAEQALKNAKLFLKTATLEERLKKLAVPVNKEKDGLNIPIERLTVSESIIYTAHNSDEISVINEPYPGFVPFDGKLGNIMPTEIEVIRAHPLPGGWLIAAIVLLVLAIIGAAATGGLVGASFLLAMPLLLQVAYFSAAATAGLVIIALLSKGMHSYLLHSIDNSVEKVSVDNASYVNVTSSLGRAIATTDAPAPPPRASRRSNAEFSSVLIPSDKDKTDTSKQKPEIADFMKQWLPEKIGQ